MASERFKLTFADGETREVVRRPIHSVRAEAIMGGGNGTMTYVYATLWAADTGGRGDRKAFEAWVDDFEDFDRIDPEEVADDANPPQGEGGSPD